MAIKDIRCPYCDKLLLKVEAGTLEIKCSKQDARRGCGRTIKFEITDESVKHTVIRE